MAYKRPIPCKNPPATLNRKRPQVVPRLNIRLRPSRFPGVFIHCRKKVQKIDSSNLSRAVIQSKKVKSIETQTWSIITQDDRIHEILVEYLYLVRKIDCDNRGKYLVIQSKVGQTKRTRTCSVTLQDKVIYQISGEYLHQMQRKIRKTGRAWQTGG
jgi:hypothetical protein